MMRNSGAAPQLSLLPSRSCPSPASRSTARPPTFVEETFGRPVCSMYGTTEIGVILVSYPGARGLRRQAGLARQADPGRQRRGAGRRGQALRARRDGRAEGVAARRLDRDQGSRPHRRGRLLLSRRPRRRRHHLRRLDDERGRDRGRDAEASRRPRSRRDRRARCAARPGREGLRRRPTAPATRRSRTRSRTSCASASASTNIRASSSSWPSCPRRRPARSTARCCAIASRRITKSEQIKEGTSC